MTTTALSHVSGGTLSPPSPVGTRGPLIDVARDVACLQVMIVNAFFVGDPADGSESWVLVDAGMPYSAAKFRAAAESRFGPGARPKAIVLTHAHFDHVGALETLAREWDVPVYAHEMELPYITGKAQYPPPDPTVGGGAMARLSFLYPRGPWDVGNHALRLPPDGSVPHMPGWRWLATPGHSPGHVSFFRDRDRVLLAGDAFVTTKQESAVSALTQRPQLNGPPRYFTQDWALAKASVRRLAELNPAVAATGHGLPMTNPRLMHDLNDLARRFDELAVPRKGRYVREPAVFDQNGPTYVPPPVPDPWPALFLGGTVAAVALATAAMTRSRGERA
jgi:glyoxylase-like metal-dependent hydrolase (beta-lactamase superfamily II)